MLQCLLYCSVDVEFKIFSTNSFENWDLYVRAKNRAISEWYQGAENFFSSNVIYLKVEIHMGHRDQDGKKVDEMSLFF